MFVLLSVYVDGDGYAVTDFKAISERVELLYGLARREAEEKGKELVIFRDEKDDLHYKYNVGSDGMYDKTLYFTILKVEALVG